MKQVAHVSGRTPEEFASAYNETCAGLSRFTIEKVQPISDTSMFVFYDVPDELSAEATTKEEESCADYCIEMADPATPGTEVLRIDIVVQKPQGRKCCECENYDWGRGCPYRHGHVQVMDDACSMFNVTIGRGCR